MPRSHDSQNEFESPLASKRGRTTPPIRRTSRACDRCRFKKSKCDGQQPCKNCSLNDRTCIYSARRRRDARNWYCGMADTVDEAMQRLYYACSRANSFPGVMPVEHEGRVTTENILNGLGLSTAPPPGGRLETQYSLVSLQQTDQIGEEATGSDTTGKPSHSRAKHQKTSHGKGSTGKARHEQTSVHDSVKTDDNVKNPVHNYTLHNMHDQYQRTVNAHKASLYSPTFPVSEPVTWWQPVPNLDAQPVPPPGIAYYAPTTLPYGFDPNAIPFSPPQPLVLPPETDIRSRLRYHPSEWYNTNHIRDQNQGHGHYHNHDPTLAEWQDDLRILRSQ